MALSISKSAASADICDLESANEIGLQQEKMDLLRVKSLARRQARLRKIAVFG
ncbi:MAG TPA: hypothetical protein VF258_03090 [Luteolibacter sp.]